MLNAHGFDLWADSYEDTVRQTEENDEYPFAGYHRLMNAVYGTVMERSPVKVLDIGLGTALLSQKLYLAGCEITGIDFSAEMLAIAQRKMPDAILLQWDFSQGLPPSAGEQTYDFIVSTYALHHIPEDAQLELIDSLLDLLKPQGRLLIGDVCFPTDEALRQCRDMSGEQWDDEEYYLVLARLREKRRNWAIQFQAFSFCCGVMEFARRP